MMKTSKNNILILLFLMCFGLAIRLYNLDLYPQHVDEIFTMNLIKKPFLEVVAFGLSQDCNPPLFYIVDWFSVHLLGFTNFAQRLPAAIFGVFAIPAAYLLGKELRDEMLGMISAAVITIAGTMWYYSQFGRGYTMVIFLFTMALVFYIRLVRNDTNSRTWWCYGLLASACVWTHLYALVPIGLMALYLLYLYRTQAIKPLVLTHAPIVVLLGTFYAIASQRQNIMQGWMGNTVPQLLQYFTLEYFGYAAILVIVLIGISLWFNKQDKVIPVLFCVWLLSFVAQLVISTITPVFVRYTLLMVPMLYVIALEPANRFIQNEDSTPAQKAFILFLFAGMFVAITAYQVYSGMYVDRQL
jgi:4-amino-4-deoxy-L-arabinose transferase-like glycosyltransferase